MTEFVIAHLREYDNRRPTGWDDLMDEFDTLAEPGHYAELPRGPSRWRFER
jgi:hypothetical protein